MVGLYMHKSPKSGTWVDLSGYPTVAHMLVLFVLYAKIVQKGDAYSYYTIA